MSAEPHTTPSVSPAVNPRDEMVTKKELAAKLKVTVRTIEHWQHDGCLPFIKVAGVLRFYWPDVVDHLKANFEVSPRGVVRPRTQ